MKSPDKTTQSKQPERLKGPAKLVAMGLLGVAALTACSPAEAQPEPSTTATETADPRPTKTPVETITPTPEPTETQSPDNENGFNVEEGLPIEKYSTPEALAQVFVEDVITDWYNAGATPENVDRHFRMGGDRTNVTTEEFATELAHANRLRYTDAILEPGWQNNPELTTWVDKMERINIAVLRLYFATYDPFDITPQDVEPYHRSSELVELVGVYDPAEDETRLTGDIRDFDNSNINRVGEELTNGESIDTRTTRAGFWYSKIDGQWRLTSIYFVGYTEDLE